MQQVGDPGFGWISLVGQRYPIGQCRRLVARLLLGHPQEKACARLFGIEFVGRLEDGHGLRRDLTLRSAHQRFPLRCEQLRIFRLELRCLAVGVGGLRVAVGAEIRPAQHAPILGIPRILFEPCSNALDHLVDAAQSLGEAWSCAGGCLRGWYRRWISGTYHRLTCSADWLRRRCCRDAVWANSLRRGEVGPARQGVEDDRTQHDDAAHADDRDLVAGQRWPPRGGADCLLSRQQSAANFDTRTVGLRRCDNPGGDLALDFAELVAIDLQVRVFRALPLTVAAQERCGDENSSGRAKRRQNHPQQHYAFPFAGWATLASDLSKARTRSCSSELKGGSAFVAISSR